MNIMWGTHTVQPRAVKDNMPARTGAAEMEAHVGSLWLFKHFVYFPEPEIQSLQNETRKNV